MFRLLTLTIILLMMSVGVSADWRDLPSVKDAPFARGANLSSPIPDIKLSTWERRDVEARLVRYASEIITSNDNLEFDWSANADEWNQIIEQDRLRQYVNSYLKTGVMRLTDHTAGDCERNTLDTLINGGGSPVVNGDTVIIPAGTCTWTTGLAITKAITLQGSGCTYDVDNRPTACSTIILDNAPDPGSGRSAILTWTLVANLNSRLTGIEFRGIHHSGTAQAGAATTITLDTGASAVDDFYNGRTVKITSGTGSGQSKVISDYVGATKVATISGSWNTNPDSSSVFVITTGQQAYNGVITVSGANTDSRRMRIDHVYFNDLNGVSIFSNTVLGVYDHNTFYKEITGGIFLYTYHTNWDGYTFSDGSWADTVDFGAEDWLYIEDNRFNRNADTPYAINDAYRGARYFVRYNDILNGWVELHGSDSGGRTRGARAVGVTFNTFDCDVTCNHVLNARSGTGVLQDNTITGYTSPSFNLAAYRLQYSFGPWCDADGRCIWDVNLGGGPFASGTATGGGSMTMVDSGASFPDYSGYSVVRTNCFWYCSSVITSNTGTTLTYKDGGDYPDLTTRDVMASPSPTTTTSRMASTVTGLALAFPLNVAVTSDLEIPCDSSNVGRLTTIDLVNSDYTWTPAFGAAPTAGQRACLADLTFRLNDTYQIWKATELFDQPGRGQGTRLLARSMSGCTSSGTTVTCTTNSAHGFSTGDYVAIADIDPIYYRDTYQITVTGTTTFTYTSPYSNLSAGTNYGNVSKVPASNDQVDEPWYECRNTQGATNVNFGVSTGSAQIRSGEHYNNDTCWSGTFYTYPHPLAAEADPPAAGGPRRLRIRGN